MGNDSKAQAYDELTVMAVIGQLALVNILTGEMLIPDIDHNRGTGKKLNGFIHTEVPVEKVWSYKEGRYEFPIMGFETYYRVEQARSLGLAEVERLNYTTVEEVRGHMMSSRLSDWWAVDDEGSLRELNAVLLECMPALAA